jgi:hypothetical protein
MTTMGKMNRSEIPPSVSKISRSGCFVSFSVCAGVVVEGVGFRGAFGGLESINSLSVKRIQKLMLN